MPLSSRTIATVLPQTAHSLMVTPLFRPMAAIVRLDGAGVNGALAFTQRQLAPNLMPTS